MNKIRYIASLLVEADTPLKTSSGSTTLLSDSEVFRDVNGLPMILGTSLTGVLRHSLKLEKEIENSIFGYQSKKDGQGSRLIVSHAYFVGQDGQAVEGLKDIEWENDFYKHYRNLPIRDHAKISHTGAIDKDERGKFDEEVVYKGTRFRFELELLGDEEDQNHWEQILKQLSAPGFRIGGGTRKGFGKLKIKEMRTRVFNLSSEMNVYLQKSASLNDLESLTIERQTIAESDNSKEWDTYVLELEPENFWLFGSGLSDDEVDMTPVTERIVTWENNQPNFSEEKVLIPSTSIKGAISHRVAFYYNKLTERFADSKSAAELKELVGSKNDAVKALFGYTDGKNNTARRGNVIFSDLFLKNEPVMKIVHHVSIDRFTGGAIPGALYDEKVMTHKPKFSLTLHVNKDAFNSQDATNIRNALERTLKDICTGMLPLGGGVMRGHGCFSGEWRKE